MKTYFQLLEQVQQQTNSQNTHLTHYEDVVFYRGYKGVRNALSLANILTTSPEALNISQKFDGAPALWFGPSPRDGRFFVSKKSIFNKDPKVYFSIDEIKADNKGDLAKKLIYAFHFLKELNPRSILQGDLLYVKGDVKSTSINGNGYITFHPNTLTYGIDTDSDLASTIIRSSIGMVLHTKWSGSDFKNLVPKFEINNSDYDQSSNVFVHIPYLNGTELIGSLPNIDKDIKQALKLAKPISKFLDKIGTNKTLSRALEAYHNSLIRNGYISDNAFNYLEGMKIFFQKKHPKLLAVLNDEQSYKQLFELHKLMTNIKTKILKSLNNNESEFKSFIKKRDGMIIETDIEGYVVNNPGHYPLKFINRLEFSNYNFDDEGVEKGWSKT